VNIGLPELGLLGFLLVILFGGGKIKNALGGGTEKKSAATPKPGIETDPKANFQEANTKYTESAKKPETPKA
jgi:hypothetical protein